MSFIQKITGLVAPSEIPEVPYPFCDISTQERWNDARREHTARIADRMRAGVARLVDSDPAVHAMADQFEAEFLDTAKRGRRG